MNNQSKMINKKFFQQEMNRISKYISTSETNVVGEKDIVHEMYIIQQISKEDLENIGPIIERNFQLDKIVKDLESKKQVEHLIECDVKTSKCMDCIKRVIGNEEKLDSPARLEDFLYN
ncbi:uncharacterized protein LOC123319754 [Coccinella septempunctata]|uniref:uncharacterized protein LOC123319754 n=1 Tax=Coccinella septempunctata TaxID=41139 RepID=UPI001D0649ED|nr:uncharacterized protein LOC123319754 [Coccinella septempunctata]